MLGEKIVNTRRFVNDKKDKSKDVHLIETSFLIPLKEDRRVGNGDFQPMSRWKYLHEQLYLKFEGYSIERGLFNGCYRDEDTGERVYDVSRKFYVAVKQKDLNIIRTFLKEAATTFCQKSIYFAITGKVEFIKGENKK